MICKKSTYYYIKKAPSRNQGRGHNNQTAYKILILYKICKLQTIYSHLATEDVDSRLPSYIFHPKGYLLGSHSWSLSPPRYR